MSSFLPHKLCLVLSAILLSTTASISHAVTKQTFSGTQCESVYSASTVYGAGIGYQYGAIENNSSTHWGYIDCPVPRANGYSSGTIADLEVSVTDTDGGMWCTAINRNRFGDTVASETVYSTGTGDRVLDFGSVAGTAYEGYITVFCVLPKSGGKIHSIVLDLN